MAVIPLVAIAAACGGSSNDTPPPPTPITNMTQATNASAAATQSVSLAWNAGASLGILAQGGGMVEAIQFRSPAAYASPVYNGIHAAQKKAMSIQQSKLATSVQKAKAFPAAGKKAQVVVSGTEPCYDGGSVSADGWMDDVTGALSVTVTFANCREGGVEMNGDITENGTMSGTGGSFTVRLGDGDGTIEDTDLTVLLYTDITYAVLAASYVADVTMSFSVGCVDEFCNEIRTTLAANGKQHYSDTFGEFDVAYANFSRSGSDAWTETGSTSNYTINGAVSESWTSDIFGATSAAVSFGNFAIGFTEVYGSYHEETADGTVVTDFTPNDYCFEGRFVIDTQVPVRTTYASGHTTQGRVVINGNVTIVYNPDGTVTVTLTGQSPQQYNSIDELGAVCAVEDMGS
jgi:hypothetical protein